MGEYSKFEKLKVWQISHELVLKVYGDTAKFPVIERQGLTKQLRRSASSIPANIAEGSGMNSEINFCRYLFIARGSLMETRYHLRLAKDLGYISSDEFQKYERDYHKVGKMLNALINSLNSTN